MTYGKCSIGGLGLTVEQAHKKPVPNITLTKQELINCKGQMFFSAKVINPGPVLFSVLINNVVQKVFDHESVAGTDLKEKQADYQPIEFMFPVGYTEPGVYPLVVMIGFREQETNEHIWYDQSQLLSVTIKE